MIEWIRFEAIIVVDCSCSYRTMEFQYIRCGKIIGQVKGDGKGNRKDECKEMEDSFRMEKCAKKKKTKESGKTKNLQPWIRDVPFWWTAEFHVYNENQCNNLYWFSFLFYFSLLLACQIF